MSKSKIVAARLTPDVKAAFDDACRALGVRPTDIIIKAVSETIRKAAAA